MATQLANLNSTINDRRRDTGSNSIDMTTVGFRAINSALQVWNQMHEWEFQISQTIFNYNPGITTYTVPSDYKLPIGVKNYRNPRTSTFAMLGEGHFDDESIEVRKFAFETIDQVEYMRVKAPGDLAVLHQATTYDGNGTWVGATAISNVGTDLYESFDLNASISFDYSGTSGTLTVTDMNPVNISRFLNRAGVAWNYFPTSVTNFTSMSIKFGSDASNYWSGTATTDYLGRTLTANQWNRFKIAWSSLTKTGSPDLENIDYIQFTLAYSVDPVMVSARIENVFATENIPLLLEYYTTSMVKAASGGTKTQIFATAANTTDTPLWSGKWDFVTEAFINSVLEYIFFITGEYTDESIALGKIRDIVNNVKVKLPSRRRYPEMALTFSTN